MDFMKREGYVIKNRLVDVVDVQFVKKFLYNGYWSTNEGGGARPNLLLTFALQLSFVCYLRFRSSR